MKVTGKATRSPNDMPWWNWLALALYTGVEAAGHVVRDAVKAIARNA